MKKLLLSLLCLGAVNAWATDVTFNFNDFSSLTPAPELAPDSGTEGAMSFSFDGATTLTAGPVSLTPAPMTVEDATVTPPRLWQTATGGQTLRFYKNNTLTFATSEQTLKTIVFNCNNTAATTENLTSNVGDVAISGKTVTWTGDAQQVVFTYLTGKTVQVNTIVASYGEGAPTPDPDPDPEPQGPTVLPTPEGTVIEMNQLGESTFTFGADGAPYGTEFQLNGYTFTVAQGEGASAPAYNKAGDIRLYAKNTLTISSADPMDTIAFVISKQGLTRYPEVAAEPAGIAQQNTLPLIWNGNATSVTFTVGEKSVYGTDGPEKAGQFDFTQVIIGSPRTGIDRIDGQQAPAVYYDLMGRRVSAPESGVYVRVQGGKAVKVVK